ncbi:MAG TPA: transcription termination/antitermination protein NusG [Actinomycetota bacterium]
METSEEFRTGAGESPEDGDPSVAGGAAVADDGATATDASGGDRAWDAPTGEDVSAPERAGIDRLSDTDEVEGGEAVPAGELEVDEADPDALPEPDEDTFVAPSGDVDEAEPPVADEAPLDREADEPVEDDSIAEDLAGAPDDAADDEGAAEGEAVGTVEVLAVDEDGDGTPDVVAVAIDEDGDGVPDLLAVAVDEDGDGVPDAVAVVVAEEGDEEAQEPEDEAAGEPEAAEESPAAEPARESAAEEAAPRARDPFGGPGDWYVVHTYAGYENKVKANLLSRIHSMQMEDKIFNVHIPMEDVLEIKGGKRQVVQRKVFPGYLLVKMFYDNDSWYVVRNTPGVTGFVSSGTGTKPTPLSKREVEKILAVKQETETKPQFRLEFEEGDTVRIVSGPFADFNGTVSEINVDQSKLKVLVSIFDRETPVELGFDQVAKV